ncbi:MAG: acetyl-CoA C-acyltransferase [Actinomycetota bacterium]|nr:acetyl-CoA C-acyltransferase [Actinomycetota bacterium]
MRDVFIVDALRTPIGRLGGALARERPDDLAGAVISSLVARNPNLDPAALDDVIFGDANGAGEDNRNVARMAVLLAGLPTSVPGVTVNRLCGSGMQAVIDAARSIATGDAEVCIAGGVESMTRAPYVLPKAEQPFPRADATLYSSTLGWRMVNPRLCPQWTVALGEGAELLAERFGIDREAQDRFALESHHKAASAWDAGAFSDEVVSLAGVSLARDESIRSDTSLDQLARLRPVFRPEGTVTAGNASPLNDGAAALLVASEQAIARHGLRPLARVASRAVSGIDPQLYGLGPVEAAERALQRAGIAWADLSVLELNEAFAAQALACLSHWKAIDPAIVNPKGGAIAIGHPLGCSGARLLATLAWQLVRRGGGYGLATMCIGVGQGIAVVLEAADGSGER